VVRTPASHVGNAGSTPAGITTKLCPEIKSFMPTKVAGTGYRYSRSYSHNRSGDFKDFPNSAR
jgi:hypothetical protein